MRWARQAVAVNGMPVDDGALPGLQRIGLVRSVRAPQFDGITFHEVLCKSALNKVPNAAALPFRYTVNGYRGCSHACRYCFARPTHEYLDFNPGTDFDTQVVVKTNVAAVLRHELRRPSWRRETVDQATRMRNGRHQHRPGASQGGGKCSPDVVVVRSGSRQQHGCDPIQIDSHPLIVPATLGCSKANGGAREPTGLRWPLA